MGVPLGGLFSTLFGGPSQPAVNRGYANVLNDWLRGKRGNWAPGSGANQIEGGLDTLFKSVGDTVGKGTPFFESMIPSAPGKLSAAAQAEKDASTDALQSSLGSERVAQTGQLGREYGGRLPASMVQSGLGSLARAGAGGATDIARNSILENINLGEQGVQGLAGLSSLSTLPLYTASNMILPAGSAGMFNAPGAINSVAKTAGNVAGGIAGFAGLGGGGGMGPGTFGSNPYGGGPGGSYGGASGLPTGGLPLNANNRQYLPMGGL